MSFDTGTPSNLKEELSKSAETKSEKPIPESLEQRDGELQEEVFGSVDKYAANTVQKERVSAFIKQGLETRKNETNARAELEKQIATGQDVVKFRNQSWRPHKEENGNILLFSGSTSPSEMSADKTMTAMRVESDDNFNVGIESKRRELEKLWKINSEIEQKFGGPKNFAQVRESVSKIRDVDQRLGKKQVLEDAIDQAQEGLGGVADYTVMGGKEDTELSKKVREGDIQKYKKELLEAEEKLKVFYDKEKPDLIAEKGRLLGELRHLAGNKK